MNSRPASFPVVLPGVCRRWRCEAGWQWTRAAVEVPPEQELWLVWAGRGRLRTAEGERALRPGSCVWMRPGVRYAATQEGQEQEQNRLGLTSLRFRFQNRALDRTVAYPEFYDVWDFTYLDAVTRRIVELASQTEDDFGSESRSTAGLLLGGVLSDLATRFAESAGTAAVVASPAERQRREAIQRAVRRIEEGFAGPLTVAGLAREVGYSAAHFSNLFRRIAGETAEAMIVRMRIERARHLLRHTGLTVGEIADRTGYRDVYFFSRQFKSKTALTPTEYRFSRREGLAAIPAAAASAS